MPKKGVVLGYLVFVILVVGLYFYFQSDRPVGQEFEPETFIIEKGEGLKEIADKLKGEGLIKNNKIFEVYVFLRNVRSNFWPGEYHLSPNMSLKDIVGILTSQRLAPEKTMTIIEGWTNKEIAAGLAKEGLVIEDDFFTALEEINKSEDLLTNYPFLADRPTGAGLEGYLFPDTYRFYEETTAHAIIGKMLENFGQKLDAQLRSEISQQGRTIFEIITMSSLVEKEAALDQDRRLVADIFWKRLDIGWALESCATINYILGAPKTRLSFEDTRTPSPYNTYLHRGLPPGPINNPGLSAIQATIGPLESDYCCFLSTPEGKIIFSRTMEEHNLNKANYLK